MNDSVTQCNLDNYGICGHCTLVEKSIFDIDIEFVTLFSLPEFHVVFTSTQSFLYFQYMKK